jgi:hypothetical protein
MKRVLLDTSVYGELVREKDTITALADLIPKYFVIYGAKIIRNELRDTPTNIKEGTKSRRILLLNLYDSFVSKHELKYNRLVDTLARDYFIGYKKSGGSLSDSAVKNDLIIIATATIYHLDLIISNDKRSMLSKSAVKAYRQINRSYGLEDPEFMLYSELKENLRRGAFQNDNL